MVLLDDDTTWSHMAEMVTACQRVGECPNLQRRRCLFGHSTEEAAAALLVGSKAPRDDVLELAAEVQGLRRVVQRLATAVAKHVVEARPPENAKDKTLTLLQQSRSLLVKLGFSGSHSAVPRQNLRSPCPLVKRGLLGPEQRENPAPALQNRQCLLETCGNVQ